MIATYTSQTTLVQSYSRTSNQAGAPLPGIPRRTSSSSVTVSPATPSPIRVMVQAPSPPHMTLGTSSSCSSSSSTLVSDTATDDWVPLNTCIGRTRSSSTGCLRPPEQSTPTPAMSRGRSGGNSPIGIAASFGADDSADEDTPRASPRVFPPARSVSSSAIHGQSAGSTHSRSQTISVPPSVEAKLILKKSGQPLKPSLKSSKSAPRGGLSVLTLAGSPFAKSEPTTPTHVKNVHFDAQLEHIKLFLAEQKPLAVSRDGSPTDDTSGTDSDFPSFIYGSSRDKPKPTLTVRNMPTVVKQDADVVLDDIHMASDAESIAGRIRVRNVAFQKWVTVRFTFDNWQTTSEVSGRYEDSLFGGAFDRFGFTIRLNGLLSRIEGREMFFAVRYCVDGREFWDNNDGKNYHAVFSLVKEQSKPQKPPAAELKSRQREGSAGSGSDVGEDLKTKLQEVVIQRWDSKVRAEKEFSTPEPSFRSTSSLASRYDFAASLKNTGWRDRQEPKANNSIPWPSDGRSSPTTPPRRVGKQLTPLGSPRDLDGENYRPSFLKSSPEAVSLSPSSATTRPRNHHRGGGSGYFDTKFAPSESAYGFGFRQSPSGTPRVRSMDDMAPPPLSSPRVFPLPSSDGTSTPTLQSQPKPNVTLSRLILPSRGSVGFSAELKIPDSANDDASAESTPSIASPTSTSSSSRSNSPSPVDAFGSNPMIAEAQEKGQDYQQFVNRFCFYTGRDNLDMVPPITRTHSASSVEEYLMSSLTPSSSTDTLRCVTPTAS